MGVTAMSKAYVIAAETISDEVTEPYVVPAQRSARVATKLVDAAATLGRKRSWGRIEVGALETQPEIPFECRICRAGPSAPFAAVPLRPTSAAMSPIDVS